jgi:membrane protease YdiL (CAAX protease family)
MFSVLSLALSYASVVTPFTAPYYVIKAIHFSAFLFVAMLILIAGKDLSRYHLEKVSLICILIFPGLLSPIPADSPPWFTVLSYAPQLLLTIFLFRRLRSIQAFGKGSVLDLARYLIYGIVIAIVSFFIANRFHFPLEQLIEAASHENPLSILNALIYQMSTSAAIEEPIFRGFLLGYLLHDRGWKPSIAVLGQTLIFWAPHIYKFEDPFLFWVAVPLGGIILGWVTLRTKNITSGMFAHAIYNTAIGIMWMHW